MWQQDDVRHSLRRSATVIRQKVKWQVTKLISVFQLTLVWECVEIYSSPHTSSFSDAQSTYFNDCLAINAGIAQSVESLAYVLDNWRVEIRIPGRSRTTFFLHSFQVGCCVHPKSNPVVSVSYLPWELISNGMKVTIHSQLIPSFKIRGAIPPLPYVFIA